MREMVPTPDQVLWVENLRVEFPFKKELTTAVDGISFDLHAGEIVAIVGESGSGKSLTALSLTGLLPSEARMQAGKLAFRDKQGSWIDLRTAAPAIRGTGIGMIFQDAGTALNPLETCGEQIAEGLRFHFNLTKEAARIQAREWLEGVGLTEVARIYQAYPHELSGGQKQRVLIAIAMSLHPRVLVADEPTTALDVTVQQQILELIKSLAARLGTAVLFISHDLNLVGSFADRVIVMRQGAILEVNKTARIFQDPAHPYTSALLRCRPGIAYKQYRLPVPDEEANEGAKKTEDLPPATHSQKEAWVVAEGLQVRFPVRRKWFWEPPVYVTALDEVGFSLGKGKTLGVAGESGSGKTTLARVLLGLQKPDQGRFWLGGAEIDLQSQLSWSKWRKKMQLIFQDPFASLNPRMSVGEAIIEPMRYHRIGENDAERLHRIEQIIKRVGIPMDYLSRLPAAFSGGQRQRIGIARALVLEPQFLICDESVASLDVSVQAHTLNLLKDLQDEHGLTYLFISHDLSVIRFMSDAVLIMRNGGVVESGVADQIFENPAHAYTKNLLKAVPVYK